MSNTNPNDTGSIRLPRSALRGSRRATREQPPLLRNGMPGQFEENHLELPVPVAVAERVQDVRVLHVDDDPQMLDLTKECLERTDEDFTVTGETSAVEGLKALQETDFDCVISDYDMPNTDGLEFLEIVREQHPDLPFVLYTAKGSEEVASEAISAGVTEYMQKESGIDQYEVLANRVRNAVDRYRSQQQFWDALSWYHRLVEQDIAGVFIIQDGEFVYVNERLADIFGYMQSELLGESPQLVAHSPEDEAALTEFMEAAGDQSHTFSREFEGRRGDDSAVTVEVHGGSIEYAGDAACLGILWRTDDDSSLSP